jgi:hypothetical protein
MKQIAFLVRGPVTRSGLSLHPVGCFRICRMMSELECAKDGRVKINPDSSVDMMSKNPLTGVGHDVHVGAQGS